MIAKISIEGITPLMTSTQHGANPLDPRVQKLADITRIPGPKKTLENHEQISLLQFEMNLPWVDQVGVVIPAVNIWNAIRDAARADKMGKNVDRYITPITPYAKLIYSGPQTKEGLLADKDFHDTRLVDHGVGGATALVNYTRPIFSKWSAEFQFRVNQSKIDPQDFARWVEEVGAYHGLMAFRKFFGRFEAQVEWGAEK